MANEKFNQFLADNVLVPIDMDKLKLHVSSEVLDKFKKKREEFKINGNFLQKLSESQFEIGATFGDYLVKISKK